MTPQDQAEFEKIANSKFYPIKQSNGVYINHETHHFAAGFEAALQYARSPNAQIGGAITASVIGGTNGQWVGTVTGNGTVTVSSSDAIQHQGFSGNLPTMQPGIAGQVYVSDGTNTTWQTPNASQQVTQAPTQPGINDEIAPELKSKRVSEW